MGKFLEITMAMLAIVLTINLALPQLSIISNVEAQQPDLGEEEAVQTCADAGGTCVPASAGGVDSCNPDDGKEVINDVSGCGETIPVCCRVPGVDDFVGPPSPGTEDGPPFIDEGGAATTRAERRARISTGEAIGAGAVTGCVGGFLVTAISGPGSIVGCAVGGAVGGAIGGISCWLSPSCG